MQVFKNRIQSNLLGEKTVTSFFSVDESLINHYNGKQVWLFGICDNIAKDFRLEESYNRNSATLKEFRIPPGNTVLKKSKVLKIKKINH